MKICSALIILTIFLIPLANSQTSSTALMCQIVSALISSETEKNEICTDIIDNDNDGLVDCHDSDCFGNAECNTCSANCRELGVQKLNTEYAQFVNNGKNIQIDSSQIQGACIKNGNAFLGEKSERGFTYKNTLNSMQREIFGGFLDLLSNDERWGYFEFSALDIFQLSPPIAYYTYNDNKVWFSVQELDSNRADNHCKEKFSDNSFDCVCSAALACPDKDGDTFPPETAIGFTCENLFENEEGIVRYDCNDNSAQANPGERERFIVGSPFCSDNLDNDCDTIIDCEESSCLEDAACLCKTTTLSIPGQQPLTITSYGIVNYETAKAITGIPIIGNVGASSTNTISRNLVIHDGLASQNEILQQIKVSVEYMGISDSEFVPDGSRPLRVAIDEILQGFVKEENIADIKNLIKENFKQSNELSLIFYQDELYVAVGPVSRSYKTGSAALPSSPIKNLNDFFAKKPSQKILNELTTMQRLDEEGKVQTPGFNFIKATAGTNTYTTPETIESELFNKVILPFYENTDEKIRENVNRFNNDCG